MSEEIKKKPAKKSVADWRIFEFLKESNGQFSSTRLFALLIIGSAITEWQYAVWVRPGIWHPDYATIGLITAVLGAKFLQKGVETKTGIEQITKIQKTIDLGNQEETKKE
jgi:hypothetical protein